MTAARQLERRGERRREIEGKIESKKETALNMLSKYYAIEEIAKLTNLLKEEIDLLRK